MEKRLSLSNIYDFYSPLLTDRQKTVFELHYFNDYSFAEIAAEIGVTRQAVNDVLRKTEKALTNYEQKLGLYEKYTKVKKLSDDLTQFISNLESGGKINKHETESMNDILHKISLIQ